MYQVLLFVMELLQYDMIPLHNNSIAVTSLMTLPLYLNEYHFHLRRIVPLNQIDLLSYGHVLQSFYIHLILSSLRFQYQAKHRYIMYSYICSI